MTAYDTDVAQTLQGVRFPWAFLLSLDDRLRATCQTGWLPRCLSLEFS